MVPGGVPLRFWLSGSSRFSAGRGEGHVKPAEVVVETLAGFDLIGSLSMSRCAASAGPDLPAR
jgi:hypothetical protein